MHVLVSKQYKHYQLPLGLVHMLIILQQPFNITSFCFIYLFQFSNFFIDRIVTNFLIVRIIYIYFDDCFIFKAVTRFYAYDG